MVTNMNDHGRANAKGRPGIPRESYSLPDSDIDHPQGDVIWETDASGFYSFVSHNVEDVFGYTTDEFVGKTHLGDFFPTNKSKEFRSLLSDRFAQREPFVDFVTEVELPDNSKKWLSSTGVPVFDDNGSFAGYHGMHVDVTHRKQKDLSSLKDEERAKRQRAVIAELAIDKAITEGILPEAIEKICKSLSATLSVERASVWVLSDDASELRCLSLYEAGSDRYVSEGVLDTSVFPAYFSAIRGESRIYASNAQSDPRTRELKSCYLAPIGITSMLDAGIFVEGELAGVVSAEHTGKSRRWHTDEEGFVSTLAAVVAQAFTNARRKKAENALRESKNLLQGVFDSIQDGISVLTPDLVIRSVNRSMEKWYSAKMPLVGKKCYEVYQHRDEPCTLCPSLESIEKKTISSHVVPLMDRQKRTGWLELYSYPLLDSSGNVSGVVEFVRDITDRKKAEEALRDSVERLAKTTESAVQALASTTELRDPYTAGHQRRVAELSVAIAKRYNLDEAITSNLRLASLVHDVGKIQVPAEILNRPGKLGNLEMDIIRDHPRAARDLFRNVDFASDIAEIVYQHHERLDGSGYPQGLSGADILLESRILAVADVVEAMSSHRPYRPALGIEVALAEIEENTNKLYDPQVAKICLKLFREEGFQFSDDHQVIL